MSYQLYRTGFVARYAQNPEMAWTGQTLGHHQWGVAVLLLRLFGDRVNLAVVWEALHHDTGEMGSCDASYPAKQKHPAMAAAIRDAEALERIDLGVCEAALTEDETAMLKFCDRLESYLFACIRTPWVLGGDGWPEMLDSLLEQAWELDVALEVNEMLREARP